jgi:tetratricopeptide (TPR) repeat protein
MHSGPTRRGCAAWVGAIMIMGCATAVIGAGPVTVGQATGKAAGAAENELDAALKKIREGHNEEALALIREQAARHPEWPPAPLILARLLLGAGQIVPGRRALEQAAIEAPTHPEVYLMFGALDLADGRFSDAQLNFENAQGLVGPAHLDAERARVVSRDALAGLTGVAEGRADWKTAQRHLNAWLEPEPKNGQVRQRLGGVLFRLGKTEDAFAALKQAVHDMPALEPAAISMGRLFGETGDIKKAQEWLDRALQLEPMSTRVRNARAGWLLDQGRAQDARSEADEAVKLDPKSMDARRLRGLIAWHLRDLAGAETLIEPLHRDTPDDAGSANLLALILVEQDDPLKRARGLQLAEVNARQYPRSHEVLATLGWAQYRSGHLGQAEPMLRAAAQGVRTTPDVAYFLARVLVDKGLTDDAVKLLQTATNLPGAFAHRDDARSLLKSLAKS